MHRIDNATAAVSLPTPDAAGTPGYWTKGNPGTGTPATVMDQDWFNAIQEEALAVLAAASIAPVKGTNNQLLAALRAMFAEAGQAFTSSGTSTVPAGVTKIRVRVWGGGGGGGGALNGLCAGTGGSAGGYSEEILTVTPGAAYTVTVGAAGAAGAAGGGNGTAGGTSSFGAECSATGGGGGFGSSSGIQTSSATPGAGSGGTLNLTGGTGGVGFITGNTSLYAGGAAAMAPFGSMGGTFNIAAAGPPGNFPGGGGGGASANAAGGGGAAGLVIVEW